MEIWPNETEQELIDFFGDPGNPPLTKLVLPYKLKASWNNNIIINYIYCNKKVAKSLENVLYNVLVNYGIGGIEALRLNQFGGCYNPRKMRGTTKWSTHAWGIALDFDPINNKLRWGKDKAHFAKNEYSAWWECWENDGWYSLGRNKNYDWMHIQAAIRK